DRLPLTLQNSQTDPFRKGITIALDSSGDTACRVAAILYLYDLCPSWTPLPPLFT
ncbi:hypothetical protein K440DRAFT_558300, partial [Wilcoxina mikolae CBS 423.85]